MTKLVDEPSHVLCVLSNMPGAHAVQQAAAYSVPSKLSPEPTRSSPGQLMAEFFSWNILLLYGDTVTEGTLIFLAIKVPERLRWALDWWKSNEDKGGFKGMC